jgi:hypothetical protein
VIGWSGNEVKRAELELVEASGDEARPLALEGNLVAAESLTDEEGLAGNPDAAGVVDIAASPIGWIARLADAEEWSFRAPIEVGWAPQLKGLMGSHEVEFVTPEIGLLLLSFERI